MKSKGELDPSQIFARILTALNARNAPEIGRKLGITKQAVYEWQKNPPGLENLIKISKTSGASLHWLITGEGQPFGFERKEPDLTTVLDDRIRRIVREEMTQSASPATQDLGTVDEFDIESAVKKYDNAATVLELWYTYDHLPVPEISAVAFSGWDKMTLDQKVEHIKLIRDQYQEDLEFEELAENAPKNTKHS